MTTDLCRAKSDKKDHSFKKDHYLKEMTWNNIRKSVELPGLLPNYMCIHFNRFGPRIQFICERSVENEAK